MNSSLFTTLLNELSESDWLALLEGKGLQLIDDERLSANSMEEPNIIVRNDDIDATTTETLKQHIIDHADNWLADYYRSHPLSNKGFNTQVEKLVNLHGYDAFIGESGQPSTLTLFVEGGEVIAGSATSPRHPYGTFMELDSTLSTTSTTKQKIAFEQWLSSNEAYQQYIGMNVCRYNC